MTMHCILAWVTLSENRLHCHGTVQPSPARLPAPQQADITCVRDKPVSEGDYIPILNFRGTPCLKSIVYLAKVLVFVTTRRGK